MTWYVAVSLSALVVMSYLLVKVRWQMRKLEEQLRFVQDKQSDGMLVSDIRILGIGKLTDSLNEILQKQRSNRLEWVQKEKRLVQTYTNLSHDIRTPLTSLDGYFQLLEDTEDAKERTRYLQIIQERIHALRDMLEELFTYTKLESRSYEVPLTNAILEHWSKKPCFRIIMSGKNNRWNRNYSLRRAHYGCLAMIRQCAECCKM